MNTTLAKDLALALMSKHNLHDWTFQWNQRKTAFGVCYANRKQIHLSRPLVECNSVAEVTDTILHEIAHALAYTLFRDISHGDTWKEICVAIGAKPERYATKDVATVKPKYYMVNSESGERLSSYHRLPKWHNEVGLRFVTGKRKETIGKLKFILA